MTTIQTTTQRTKQSNNIVVTDYSSIARLLLREFGNNWRVIHRALEYNGFNPEQFDNLYRQLGAIPPAETPKEAQKHTVEANKSAIEAESKQEKKAETLTELNETKEANESTNESTKSAETPRESSESTQNPLNVLESYLKRGIALIPSKDKKPLIAYSKDESKLIRTLQDLEKWQEKGIKEFGFIPSKAGLIVIDLDKGAGHSNKSDGIANFRRLIERNELAKKEIFKDFPNNYPCYTETANGGLHLYFSDEYLSESRLKEFNIAILNAQNIEIKFNAKVTTAGSVINGKPYTLHGNLDDIPTMTIPIIDALSKPVQKPQHKTFARRFEKSDNRGLWNKTPQSIIDKAIEKYSGLEPHNFAYKTAVLFKLAGFDLQTAETYILNTPQHINRNDQKDTITAIESIFR